MDIPLQEISLYTPVEQLGEHTLVVTDTGRAVLHRTDLGQSYSKENPEPGALEVIQNGVKVIVKDVGVLARPLLEAVGLVISELPLRAFAMPEGRLVAKYPGPRRFMQVAGSGVLFALFGTAFGVAGFGIPAIRDLLGWLGGLVILAIAGFSIYSGWDEIANRRLWAYQVGDEARVLEDFDLGDRDNEAIRMVEGVKEEYGRLLSDLPYRIEYPALFDASSPQAEELTLALFEWDSTWAHLEGDARVALAGRVARAFQAAKAHAERVGVTHFPEAVRDRASRALGAARVAVDKQAPRGERDAALRVVVDILDDLALFYLPTVTQAREAIQGRQLRQLPGRRGA